MADLDGLVPILLGVVGLAAFAGGMTGIVVGVRRWRRERRAALSHRSAIGRIGGFVFTIVGLLIALAGLEQALR